MSKFKPFAVVIFNFALYLCNFALPPVAYAHPMGNFSINHYSGLQVGKTELQVRYILDFAEIPTFQEMQALDRDRNGTISPSERDRYLSEKAQSLTTGLLLQIDDKAFILIPIAQDMTVTSGAGGLPTIKVSVLYHAVLDGVVTVNDEPTSLNVFYQDRNYPGRAGWKEMTVAGSPGIRIVGSMLPISGGELRAYPENDVSSPPQITEARFSFEQGTGPDGNASMADPTAIPKTNSRWSTAFTSLITGRPLDSPTILLSLVVAFGLGAIHALSPGHGKTVVAAYLVGSRGTARHALLLGATVTVSHTIGVFLLGLATLYFSKYFVPERLYPWLGLFSGLTICVIGLTLLRQRWRSIWTGHKHVDEHGHGHIHDGQEDGHGHSHINDGSLKSLLGLGITGGIIPCPSALVVLLSAIAFHQIAFGLLLIVAFSAGIAATLVGIGFLMVYVGETMGRVNRFPTLTRLLPVVSAAGVTVLGGMIALGSQF
ncbi:MAG: sulfite exporter TauE/SafE family protein [Nitrospirota bacterium]|nr:sulfite exporter TauE/SafE family protein [Nitrospirota bacterium]